MAVVAPPSPAPRPELVINQTHADVTRDVVATLDPASRGYLLLLGLAVAMFLGGLTTFLILVKDGLGLAGYTPPVFWSVYITTFVFWVGIGHAGTLISAILFLFRSPWRTAVYRSTEAMTVFAVMTAALFPIIHIGRQWVFYWLLPYPNQRWLWPNFKSPLIWDVFAISTYFTVSSTFLVFGLIPDVAAVRDKVTGWRKTVYTLASAGLAGDRQPVASLLARVPLPGRAGHPAGALGALGGVLGLRDVDRPRLARHDLRSLLRGRRHLLGSRHGDHPAHPAPPGAQDRAHDHRLPLRQPGQADAADRLDPVLRLRDGVLRGVVQRQHLRADHVLPPGIRLDVVGGLDHDHLQRLRVAAAVVPEDPHQPDGAVRHLDLRQHRDVVRALRDHRLVAQQRLHPVGLGQREHHLGRLGDPGWARSAGSGCGSCCSPRASRSWRSRRSRK